MPRGSAARAPRRAAAALACALLLACGASAAAAMHGREGLALPAAAPNASETGAALATRALLGFFSGAAAVEEPDPERIEKIGYVKARGCAALLACGCERRVLCGCSG